MRVALLSYHYLEEGLTRPVTLKRAFLASSQVKELRVFHADFEHISKKQRSYPHDVVMESIPVPAYRRNLSLMRLWSHMVFAWRLRKRLRASQWDLLWVCVPPNLTVLVALLGFPSSRVIVDVVDVWPEALPFPGFAKRVFMEGIGDFWCLLRNRLFSRATRVVAVNRYFLKLTEAAALSSDRLCLTNEDASLTTLPLLRASEGPLLLCYLGSINNVIDIGATAAFVRALCEKRPVRVEILGSGEKATEFVHQLRSAGAEVIDHGVSFDLHLKREILGRAHWGLNLYKPSTTVGLSYKSVDYLAAGVPILNATQGDLAEWIRRYACGVAVAQAREAADLVASLDETARGLYAKAARRLYEEELHPARFRSTLERILKDDKP